jgi:hypothetical protein
MTRDKEAKDAENIRNSQVFSAGKQDTSAPETTSTNQTVRRTFLLKILIIGFLLLAWFGGVRFYAVFGEESLLSEYISRTGLIYIAFGGAIWALAGLASAVSLWMGFSFSASLARLTALVCLAWYWFDYLFLSQSPLSKTNWFFTLAASLLALAFAWYVPVLPKEKRFLHRRL